MQEEAERVAAKEAARKAMEEEAAMLAKELEERKAAYMVQMVEKAWEELVVGGSLEGLGAC